MGEINIDWNYVAAKPENSATDDGEISDAEKARRTKQVLEEEVRLCLTVLAKLFALCHQSIV